ncbi:hypothetical protein PV721_38965 [Streptomyces sp. MB09-01]|uniref:hypothetical protein n=1 Tax=Streptomyces sp. MB09-01 TaxID=3028666 RepID=UPI0029A1AEFC|nr:hypothetical protein [Streptomyces sp. MB09-01]MDX3540184.1 hypothetical protein [Streptomyces sp. MB09-01]
MTAPAGAEPAAYRIEDVSAAAATVLADAGNDVLLERSNVRAPGRRRAGRRLHPPHHRSLRATAHDENGESDEGWPLARRTASLRG